MATEDLLVTLGDLGTVFSYKTDTTVIANNYSTSATYSIGDYCIYAGVLQRCIFPINTPETFTQAHWTVRSVSSELKLIRPLTPSSAFSIPSEGNSVGYNMSGLTSDYVLIYWGFQSSPENSPPADLSWMTYDGYFTITNNGGTTSETMRPVFVRPTAVSYAAR